MFARLAINLPAVSGVFDYSIPDQLAAQIGVGSLVTAPFAKQTVQGVVLEFVDEAGVPNVKPIESVLDVLPVLTVAQIELAKWMSAHYLQPLAAMIGLMLPIGLSQQADVFYTVNSKQLSVISEEWSGVQKRILALLEERGPLRGRQIDTHFKQVDWRKTAQGLVRRGVLSSQSVLPPPRVRAKYIRVAQLAVTPEEAEAAMPTLGTKQTLARRQAALGFLVRALEAVNLSWVYAETGCNLADLEILEERGLIRLFENEIFRDPLQRLENIRTENRELTLTPEQNFALTEILKSVSSLQSQFSNSPILAQGPQLPITNYLLHGVTSSGKTEIYLRAAEEVVHSGRQVIVLVPEIALTPQTVRRFLERFPGQVGLVHSKLSEGERYDTWRRARSGQLKVIIGARSALFAPLPNIGLIVADECHDSSFYQSEPPFYNAVASAQTYARLCGAVCVLGSATPSVEQQFHASEPSLSLPPFSKKMGGDGGGLHLLSLPHRVTDSDLPPVQIVDMRVELQSGNRGIFSRPLAEALAETLERGEQAILFLNRRGTATYVFCRNCGTAVKCPRCDTPLTYHVNLGAAKNQIARLEFIEGSKVNDLRPFDGAQDKPSTSDLLCHRCGYQRQMPKKCAECGSDQIRQFGLGSEKVEADVQAMLPSVRTLRWDWETTRQKDAHEIILTHFANHQADVLVGTQMLAKGLDLPLVTLVGIVLADVGLNLPDPFASERTFQVLTQVAGRAGRSARGGKVILQTFAPEHYVIQSAAGHDVAGFQKLELAFRQSLGHPPYARLVRLEYRHKDSAKAESESNRVLKIIQQKIIAEKKSQTTASAVPCFFSKVDGIYRWQIILRGPNPAALLAGLPLDNWRVEVEPVSVL